MNSEQRAAFDSVKSGKNIFLTGPAGSGKSYLIREITEWCAATGKKVGVTALTGCAALLLSNKAKTLHSWAGVGLGKESVDVLVASIQKGQEAKRRWKQTQILIIDEVSMMTPEFFEKLDVIGKKIRKSGAPWGGIQLVLCGDFFQLPPVVRGISGESTGAGRFAFESASWKAAGLISVVLTKIERQVDPEFQTLLNECRIGAPSKASIALLRSRQGLDWKEQRIRPTLLFSRNADVDTINEKNVDALIKNTKEEIILYKYDAKTEIHQDPELPITVPTGELLTRFETKLDNDANYAPHLELCKGCQVMLLKNIDIKRGLVNGSRGVITNFESYVNLELKEEKRKKFHKHFEEIKMKLALLDKSAADDFVKTGLFETTIDDKKIRVILEDVVITQVETKIPIVQFIQGDPIPIRAQEWQSNDCPIVYRSQIPLRVAYAITIHKSQGATLDCALIDIGKSTFECGQAYVALSRVRDLSGLYVYNLEPSRIIAHPTVVDFYIRLMDTEYVDPPAVYMAKNDFGDELEDEGWRSIVSGWTSSMIGQSCIAKVKERSEVVRVFPAKENILASLTSCPLSSVKVVVLGQDPYHGVGQAHGLSFSVGPGTVVPPSLKNIRKEMLSDLGLDDGAWPLGVGTLTPWAKQGVLLLNAVLTVEEGNPNSHADMGWEDLTQRLLGAVVSSHADEPLVFLAWGKFAQNIIDRLSLGPKHKKLIAPHPSPFSASSGFFGSRPFSQANAHLVAHGCEAVNWRLGISVMTEDPS